MTGYGLSSSIEGDSEITIEIKGVNHKFLEISLKSHEINNDIDQYIRNAVGKNIVRGKVDIKIKLSDLEAKTSYSNAYQSWDKTISYYSVGDDLSSSEAALLNSAYDSFAKELG